MRSRVVRGLMRDLIKLRRLFRHGRLKASGRFEKQRRAPVPVQNRAEPNDSPADPETSSCGSPSLA
jgi:hypothetical protein